MDTKQTAMWRAPAQIAAVVGAAFSIGLGGGRVTAPATVETKTVEKIVYKGDDNPQTAMRTLCRYAIGKNTPDKAMVAEECDRPFHLENQAKYLIGAIGPGLSQCEKLTAGTKEYFDCYRAEAKQNVEAFQSLAGSKLEKLRIEAEDNQAGRCNDERAKRSREGRVPPTPEECKAL